MKTEAVVLRSMRYGEADRILHLYTPEQGRMSAIAKGSRRPNSRFGGRLEPFFRLRMDLHEGRSELLTVTGAQTVDGYRAPARRRARDRRRRACLRRRRAPVRDLRGPPGACSTCSATRSRCSTGSPRRRALARALAFRLKLLVAAGLTPSWARASRAARATRLTRFSGRVAAACEACYSQAAPESRAHRVLSARRGGDALHDRVASHTLAEAPERLPPALRQAERAIAETVEHHAHVRLRPRATGAAERRRAAMHEATAQRRCRC